MKYESRSDHDERPFPSFREALEPYLTTDDPGPYAKLSISVPEKLLATVREVAAEPGATVSGVVAASLRRLVGEVEQAGSMLHSRRIAKRTSSGPARRPR